MLALTALRTFQHDYIRMKDVEFDSNEEPCSACTCSLWLGHSWASCILYHYICMKVDREAV